jgi:hypothetical protein
MPALETYPELVGSDLSKVISLWRHQPDGLLKAGKVLTDITIERFLFRINPTSQEVAQVQKDWSNAGAYTVPPNFSIQALERQYVFKDRDQVFHYLENHPFLVPLLLEAYSKIDTFFPEYPQVLLEVVTDPEVPDDTQLVASIRVNLSPDEALERLDSFDRQWWLPSMDRAKGELCIHVEFI